MASIQFLQIYHKITDSPSTKKENPKTPKKNFEKLTFNLINWKEKWLTWTPGVLRFKTGGVFSFGQMAKRKPMGVGFRFRVSFRAIVCGGGLLVSGTGKAIAVYCVYLVSSLVVGYVCKGVISFLKNRG